MNVDDLITLLQRVKDEKGNIEVVCSSFCGTNESYVTFDITEREDVKVKHLINGLNQLCLSMTLTKYSWDRAKDEIETMKRLGYDFYRTQYTIHEIPPIQGLSPCDWHVPW